MTLVVAPVTIDGASRDGEEDYGWLCLKKRFLQSPFFISCGEFLVDEALVSCLMVQGLNTATIGLLVFCKEP